MQERRSDVTAEERQPRRQVAWPYIWQTKGREAKFVLCLPASVMSRKKVSGVLR